MYSVYTILINIYIIIYIYRSLMLYCSGMDNHKCSQCLYESWSDDHRLLATAAGTHTHTHTHTFFASHSVSFVIATLTVLLLQNPFHLLDLFLELLPLLRWKTSLAFTRNEFLKVFASKYVSSRIKYIQTIKLISADRVGLDVYLMQNPNFGKNCKGNRSHDGYKLQPCHAVGPHHPPCQSPCHLQRHRQGRSLQDWSNHWKSMRQLQTTAALLKLNRLNTKDLQWSLEQLPKPWPCFIACCLWSSSACLSSHWSYSTTSLGKRNFRISRATSKNLGWQRVRTSRNKHVESIELLHGTVTWMTWNIVKSICFLGSPVPACWHFNIRMIGRNIELRTPVHPLKQARQDSTTFANQQLNALMWVEVVPEFIAGQGPKDQPQETHRPRWVNHVNSLSAERDEEKGELITSIESGHKQTKTWIFILRNHLGIRSTTSSQGSTNPFLYPFFRCSLQVCSILFMKALRKSPCHPWPHAMVTLLYPNHREARILSGDPKAHLWSG